VRTFWLAALVAVFGMTGMTSISANAGDLTLKRVMLSTGGVGYLEYEAQVTGDAELTLDVPLNQVDDVLKSIIVYDSKGGVGSARLAGRDPLSQLFSDLPFGREALNSPAALLNALQGAEIRVGSSRPIAGKLLRVVPEQVQLGDRGATTTRNRVSVLTDAGLQQFMLEEAENVSFVDASLQAKVNKALAEIAVHRAKDRRQIVLATKGVDTRTLRVGYVVAASLWKATFRLSLPHDSEKAHLQGWAVLENMSGQDWKGIELTLLSGNPVSFRQAIYEAYYVTRPEVPVEVAGRVLPTPDTGVVGGENEKFRVVRNGVMQPAPSAPASAARAVGNMAGNIAMSKSAAEEMSADAAARPEPQISQAVNAAAAEEGITQVAFRLPVAVDIASGQSAIVPIFDRDLPIERLALFQPGTSMTHPLASLRIKNDSPTGLPPGVLTLYEESAAGVTYLGDARLAQLPAGESRLVSYAVDEKTKIVREQQGTRAISKGAIAQGVLTLTRTQRQTTVYKIAAPVNETRKVIIDHPKMAGWTLVAPGGTEETAGAHRLTVALKAGEAQTVMAVLEMPVLETLRVADMADDQIAEVTDTHSVATEIKNAFAELARLRRLLAQRQAEEEQIKAKIATLQTDQARIRDNLERVDRDSGLHKRYVEKLNEQETQFETLQVTADKAAESSRAAGAAIDAYIASLRI
jgi:hypothetical protein